MPVIGGGGGGGNNAGGGSAPLFIPYTMVFTIQLPIPEWAIPMIKVVPRCYIDDGHDPENLRVDLECQHMWIISKNTDSFGNELTPTVTLQVSIYAEVDDFSLFPRYQIPTYIDVDLVFFNERTFNELNTNKH